MSPICGDSDPLSSLLGTNISQDSSPVMQSFFRNVQLARCQSLRNSLLSHFNLIRDASVSNGVSVSKFSLSSLSYSRTYLLGAPGQIFSSQVKPMASSCYYEGRPALNWVREATVIAPSPGRHMTTGAMQSHDASSSFADVSPRVKFKRLDKTARHIMQILDKEAVQEVNSQREIPDIKPGYIVQLKVEVPENKRRISTVKGIVIARRNAGLNTTFRIRRLVAGVGVESLFPLYSPNIKEIKVLDKKNVRRAKLYYLRDKMNALKKH